MKEEKIKKTKDEKRFDLKKYSMFYMAHILQRNAENMASSLRPLPFDNSTWRILASLQYKDHMTIKELAHFSVLERSFVGRLVLRMEGNGLVQREMAPDDRRAVTVSLTPHGKKTFSEVLCPVAVQQEQNVFAGIAQTEMEVFFSVLSRAMENVYRTGSSFPPISTSPKT